MVTALRLLAASCWFGVGWAHTQPAPNVAFDIHSPKDFVRFSISDGDPKKKPQNQILSAAGVKDLESAAFEKLKEMEKYAEDALSEKLLQAREQMNKTRAHFDAVSEKIAAKLLERERALAQRWQQLAVASSHGLSGKCCCKSGGGCSWEPFVEGKDKNCPQSNSEDYRDRVKPTGAKGLIAAQTVDGLLSQCAGSDGWIVAANLAAEKKAAAEEAARLELEKKRAAAEKAAHLEAARKKAAAEQAARLAAERKAAAEQEARLEAERKAAEEQAARQEAERKAAEEQAGRQEAERKRAEEQAARVEAERRRAEAERREAERAAAEKAERREAARIAAEKQKAAEDEEEKKKLFAERAAKNKEAAEEATRLLTEISAAQDEESAAAKRKETATQDGASLEVEKAAAEEAQWRRAKSKAVEQLGVICLEASKRAEDEDGDGPPTEEEEAQAHLEKACQERNLPSGSPGEVDGQPPGAGSTPVDPPPSADLPPDDEAPPVDTPSSDPDAVDGGPPDSENSPTEDETPDDSESAQASQGDGEASQTAQGKIGHEGKKKWGWLKWMLHKAGLRKRHAGETPSSAPVEESISSEGSDQGSGACPPKKPGDPYSVMLIFAGREKKMHIMVHYVDQLVKECQLDEVHVWQHTNDTSDADWLEETAASRPAYQLLQCHGDWSSIYAYYASVNGSEPQFKPRWSGATRERTVLIKTDDDMVYIDTVQFSTFVDYVAQHDEKFIVHANTVNNGVASYYQAHHIERLGGMLPELLEYPTNDYDDKGNPTSPGLYGKLLTGPPAISTTLHRDFLDHMSDYSWSDADTGPCVVFRPPDTWHGKGQGRFSINWFGALWSHWDKVADFIPPAVDDESALTTVATERGEEECMFTPFNVVHYSYSCQKHTDDILQLYEALISPAGE